MKNNEYKKLDENELIIRCQEENEEAWVEFQKRFGRKIYWFPIHKYYKIYRIFDEELLHEYEANENVVLPGEFYDETIKKLKDKGQICKFNLSHKSGASFETWLYTVMNNLWVDLQRKKDKEHKILISGDEPIGKDKDGKPITRFDLVVESSLSVEEQVEMEEMINCLNKLILQLSARRRLVLKLWRIDYFDILPDDIREISLISEEPVEEVTKKIREGLSTLQKRKRKGSTKIYLTADEIGEILNCSENTVGVEIMRIRELLKSECKKYL